MYYNNSMKWNMLQHYNKYQNNQNLNSVTEWVRYIAIYFNLPSDYDIWPADKPPIYLQKSFISNEEPLDRSPFPACVSQPEINLMAV